MRRFYAQLGIGDRTEIEFFDGGHVIHGQGTFAFLASAFKLAEVGTSFLCSKRQAHPRQPLV